MQALYGCFVCDGCDKSIDCPMQLADSISSNLWPAYEDHALSMLLIPWLELCSSEDKIFQEVDCNKR